MKNCSIRKMLPIGLLSLGMFFLPMLAVALLLRNLGSVIAILFPSDENAGFDFPRIFEQLRDADLSLHWAIPLACAVGFGCLLFFVFKKIQCKLAAGIIVGFSFVILFLVAFLLSLMLTSVNGIRFGDLLSKLIPLMDEL